MAGIIITMLALLAMFAVCGGMLLMLMYFISFIEILRESIRVVKLLDRVFKGR